MSEIAAWTGTPASQVPFYAWVRRGSYDALTGSPAYSKRLRSRNWYGVVRGQGAHRDGEDRSLRQDWATDCRTRVSSQEVWRRANPQRRRVQASPAVLSSEAYETWAGPA
jgi:hypothetical protein